MTSPLTNTVRCAACKTTEVGPGDHCYGCKQTVCYRCAHAFGHFGDNAHALSTTELKRWEDKMAKKRKKATTPETLEGVIRMATRVQARLREEGVELSWQMAFRPLSLTEKPVK